MRVGWTLPNWLGQSPFDRLPFRCGHAAQAFEPVVAVGANLVEEAAGHVARYANLALNNIFHSGQCNDRALRHRRVARPLRCRQGWRFTFCHPADAGPV